MASMTGSAAKEVCHEHLIDGRQVAWGVSFLLPIYVRRRRARGEARVTTTTGEAVDLPIDVLGSAAHELCAEHDALAQEIEQLPVVADAIAVRTVAELRGDLERALSLVADRILPHIRTEYDHHAHLAFHDCRPVPSRADVDEIDRLAERFTELGRAALRDGADAPHALRATLFDLHTILRLHFASGC